MLAHTLFMRGQGVGSEDILYGDFQRTVSMDAQDRWAYLGDLGAWDKFSSFGFGLPIAEAVASGRDLDQEQISFLAAEAGQLDETRWRQIWDKIDKHNRKQHGLARDAIHDTFSDLRGRLVRKYDRQEIDTVTSAIVSVEDAAYAILATEAIDKDDREYFMRPWSRMLNNL